eukprot:g2538.t1
MTTHPTAGTRPPLREFLADPSWGLAVVAHRGAWHGAPENSIPSVELAIRNGYEFVEIDVQQTADGALICLHDDTLDRMTGQPGTVSQLPVSEITALCLKAGAGGDQADLTDTRPPLLGELLDATAGKIYVDVDVKHLRDLEAVADFVRTHPWRSHINLKTVVAGKTDLKRLDELEKHSGVLVKPMLQISADTLDTNLDLLSLRPTPLVEGLFDSFATFDLYVRRAKSAGTDVFLNTLDEVPSAERNDASIGLVTIRSRQQVLQARELGVFHLIDREDRFPNLLLKLREILGDYSKPNLPAGLPEKTARTVTSTSAALSHMSMAALSGTPLPVRKLAGSAKEMAATLDADGLDNWLTAVQSHHSHTYCHTMMVAGHALTFSKALGMSQQEQYLMGLGGLVHDLGKVKIPLSILDKPGKLTPKERELVNKHPVYSKEILESRGEMPKPVIDMALWHHEFVDGSGYPEGLSGDQISERVRLITIVDIYSALTEKRSYKDAVPPSRALAIMGEMEGKLDAGLLQKFSKLITRSDFGRIRHLKNRQQVMQARELGCQDVFDRNEHLGSVLLKLRKLIGDYARPQLTGRCSPRLAETVTSACSAYAQMSSAALTSAPLPLAKLGASANHIANTIEAEGLNAWLSAVELHHSHTFCHTLMVTGHATNFAQLLGLSKEEQSLLGLGGLVHDLGKVKIPLSILDKPGKLSDAERQLVNRHPVFSREILKDSTEVPSEAYDIAVSHHEFLDGSGYPDGLKGNEISNLVRITTICDIYSALTEKRAYKDAMSPRQAFAVMLDMGGKLDSRLLKSFRDAVLSTELGQLKRTAT